MRRVPGLGDVAWCAGVWAAILIGDPDHAIMMGQEGGLAMFSPRRLAAGALESYLGLVRSEAAELAAAMTPAEVQEVLRAQQSIEPLATIGELVPLLMLVEMRAIDEDDEAKVCAVIERGQRRLEAATRRATVTGG